MNESIAGAVATRSQGSNGRYSWLAFIECAAATTFLGWLVFRHDDRDLLLGAVLIAPLMLLQTRYGGLIKAQIFGKCEPFFRPTIVRSVIPKLAILGTVLLGYAAYHEGQFSKDMPIWLLVIFMAYAGFHFFFFSIVGLVLLWLLALAGVSLLIRIAATIVALAKHPGDCILSVADNWNRVCFRTDFRTPPELFPGSEGDTQYGIRQFFRRLESEILGFADYFPPEPATTRLGKIWQGTKEIFNRSVPFLAASLAMALLYLAAASYRISLKSTFLIYLPLFYFAHVAVFERQPRSLVQRVREAKGERVVAGIILVSHAGMPFAIAFLVGAALIGEPQDPLAVALIDYLSFNTVSANAVAKILNAVLVFLCFRLARIGVHRLEDDDTDGVTRVSRTLRVLILVRAVLTIYTIFYAAVLVSYHVNPDQMAAGLRGVVAFLQSIRIDWSPLPGGPPVG